jgi:uncharacterized protein
VALARPGTLNFFLLTFAITWGLQFPGVFAQRGILPGDPDAYMPLAGLGIFGPLATATFLSYREGGKPAVRALYSPLLRFRVHPGWYAAALLLPGALLTSVLWLLNLAGRDGPVAYVPGLSGVAFGLVISVAEELAWRGYALPRLETTIGTLGASLLIGVMWYLWHIPMFLGLGVPLNLVFVMLLYFTGASMFLGWIYNGTQGSLLLVALGHLGAHLNNSHRALPLEVVPLVVHAVLYAALGLTVMWLPLHRAHGASPDVSAKPKTGP